MSTRMFSLTAFIVGSSLLHAGFSERKLENAIVSATKAGKPIAFVFYQDYALPNCPKCVTRTDANNKAIKGAIPRPEVVVVEIDPGDKNLDKLPACVSAKGASPRIVIVDSQAKEVIVTVSGAPDREKAAEIKALVKKVRPGA